MPPMPGIPRGAAVRNTMVDIEIRGGPPNFTRPVTPTRRCQFHGSVNQGGAPRLLCRGGAPSPPGDG